MDAKFLRHPQSRVSNHEGGTGYRRIPIVNQTARICAQFLPKATYRLARGCGHTYWPGVRLADRNIRLYVGGLHSACYRKGPNGIDLGLGATEHPFALASRPRKSTWKH